MKYLKFLKIGDFKELFKIEFYKYSPVYKNDKYLI